MPCTKRKIPFWKFHIWGRMFGTSENPMPASGWWRGEAFQTCRACGEVRSMGHWERDVEGYWTPFEGNTP